MGAKLQEITGYRGEKVTELALTKFSDFSGPLFSPGFLGDKWPAIDFYVELNEVRGRRPYFFVQTKTTRASITKRSRNLTISSKAKDIQRLKKIPGPTYLIGVHEPTQKAYIRSVHSGLPNKAITTIPLEYELTSENLRVLHSEVKEFWAGRKHKPTNSTFT